MKKNIVVRFEPIGKKAIVEPGVTVLDLAKEAGVGIRSECAGNGRCGKCRIVIKDQRGISSLSEEEKTKLTPQEILMGYRLACSALVMENAVIVVPKESQIRVRKIQIVGMERAMEFEPAVRKLHVTPSKPTIYDVVPDLERLLNGLGDIKIDYDLLKILPGILREAAWDVTVTVYDNQKIIDIEAGNTVDAMYGLAIDIGTSKIVGYLVDLTNGEVVGVGAIENPQIAYGEDILSRVHYATTHPEGLSDLKKLVVDGVNNVLYEACQQAQISPRNVYEVTIAGNTAMHHLFLEIQPKYMGVAPYVPVVKQPVKVKAGQLGLKVNQCGTVYALPNIAGYVGADAVGDVLATGIYESNDMSLLVDVGTNGEVFVGNKEDIVSCSCAAGPAFEGVQIKHGMKAVTGAIEKVLINPETYEVTYETVGGVKPVGICGSGIIDVVAEMLRCGIIDNKGHFSREETPRVRVEEGNYPEFVIAWAKETGTGKEIIVNAHDIGEIQLAKAAIHAGCSILMKRKNVSEEDLDRVYIAGAFGNYINPQSAKFLGLIPDVPIKKIKFVGNTALSGAKMVLTSREARKAADMLSRRVRYIELMIEPDFRREFTHSIPIPHKDLDRYPSVKKGMEEQMHRFDHPNGKMTKRVSIKSTSFLFGFERNLAYS